MWWNKQRNSHSVDIWFYDSLWVVMEAAFLMQVFFFLTCFCYVVTLFCWAKRTDFDDIYCGNLWNKPHPQKQVWYLLSKSDSRWHSNWAIVHTQAVIMIVLHFSNPKQYSFWREICALAVCTSRSSSQHMGWEWSAPRTNACRLGADRDIETSAATQRTHIIRMQTRRSHSHITDVNVTERRNLLLPPGRCSVVRAARGRY